MDYSIKGKAGKVMGYVVAWLMFSVFSFLIYYMIYSGMFSRGFNYVWNRFLDKKVYNDVSYLADSYCYDYLKAKNREERYDERFYAEKLNVRNTNLRFSCALNDEDNTQIPGNYDPTESKQFIKNYEIELKTIEDTKISYVFNWLQFKAFFRELDDHSNYNINADGDNYYVELISESDENYVASFQCYIPAELTARDGYYHLNFWLKKLYNFRHAIFLLAVLSFVTVLYLAVKLIMSAGLNEKGGKTCLRTADMVPLDVFTLACFASAGLLLRYAVKLTARIPVRVSVAGVIYDIMMFGLAMIICGLIILEYSLSLTVRIRRNTWFENNVLYRFVLAVMHVSTRIVKAFGNLRAFWKVGLCFLGVNLAVGGLGTIIFMAGEKNGYLTVLAIIMWTLIAILIVYEIVVLYNINILETACNTIADGKLDFKIKEHLLLWPFRRTADSINHISDGMKIALQDQIKSEHFKTELITNVSHDIKTPLTSIITYVNLLQKSQVNGAEAEEYLDVLERQSDKLKKLIEDLVEASKASTGNIELSMSDIEIILFVEQAIAEYDERFKEKELKLVFDKPDEDWAVHVDGQQLWRVIDNLFSNICKYSLEKTRVFIELRKEEEYSFLSVKNISGYELELSSEELTERFVRGDKSRHTEGSGLGLSIARSLSEAMGGALNIETDGDLFKAILKLKNAGAENEEDGKKEEQHN